MPTPIKALAAIAGEYRKSKPKTEKKKLIIKDNRVKKVLNFKAEENSIQEQNMILEQNVIHDQNAYMYIDEDEKMDVDETWEDDAMDIDID